MKIRKLLEMAAIAVCVAHTAYAAIDTEPCLLQYIIMRGSATSWRLNA